MRGGRPGKQSRKRIDRQITKISIAQLAENLDVMRAEIDTIKGQLAILLHLQGDRLDDMDLIHEQIAQRVAEAAGVNPEDVPLNLLGDSQEVQEILNQTNQE